MEQFAGTSRHIIAAGASGKPIGGNAIGAVDHEVSQPFDLATSGPVEQFFKPLDDAGDRLGDWAGTGQAMNRGGQIGLGAFGLLPSPPDCSAFALAIASVLSRSAAAARISS